MRYELVKDLLHHLDRDNGLKVGHADEKTTGHLEGLPIPLDLKRLLQWSWTTSGGQVGPYFLDSVNSIPDNYDYERLMLHHLIPVGHAANGDILVIRFEDEHCRIGLVSHDELWEEVGTPDAAFVEVAPTLDEYFWRVCEGRYLPIDFYAASELAELRREVTLPSHSDPV